MARCRVCHRELHNPAHIAAGVGPVCAQRQARYGVGTGERPAAVQAAYPSERLARIERALARLGQMIEQADRYGFDGATFELVIHWYERWRRIERNVRRAMRLASVAA